MPDDRQRSSRSLRSKFILLCVPSLSLVLAGMGYSQYSSQEKEMTASLTAAIESTTARLAANLAFPVWNLYKDQAFNQLLVEMSSGDIESIVVRDESGAFFSGVIRRGGKPVALQEAPSLSERLGKKQFDIRYENKTIAKGEIFFSRDRLEKALQQQMRGSLVQILVVDLLLSTILVLILSALVTGPIQRLRLAAEEAVRTGDLRQEIAMTARDEVGALAAAIGEMMANLRQRTEEAKAIATGNLTVDIAVASERDAFGNAFRQMAAELQKVVREVGRVSEEVANGSDQINDAGQNLSQGATEQASSISEISSSLGKIGLQSKSNADTASEANQRVTEAKEAAQGGVTQMKTMVAAMQDINASSQEIAKIIKVIDDIAFQTNLLALNAAVEAARAGKHGKGFAVVAEEVRNLAGRSAKAASETARMIGESGKKVENGLVVANAMSAAFDQIASSVARTSENIGAIASASREQAQGISGISKGLGEIDQVTQRTAASAEETASASEELRSAAALLVDLIKRFKIGERGHSEVAARKTSNPLSPPMKRAAGLPARGTRDGGGKLGAAALFEQKFLE
jgi:methyl-accepting chemotaxis protein